MFRKTLIKLTALNSVILIIIMGVLGSTIYFYTKGVLYRNIDHTLNNSTMIINHPHGPAFRDPSISILLWNNKKQFIGTSHGFLLDSVLKPSDIKKMKPKKLGKIQEIKLNGFYLRYNSVKIQTSKGPAIAEVVFITNSEKKMLNTLLLIILGGWLLGSLLAVFAGYFLARRALQPIQNSWEKQQQFVSDASHELRTPLTIIQSRIEMLLHAPQSRIQDKLRDISVTLKETRRLSKLVSHLLTLAGSDADRIEVEQNPILLNDIIGQVAEPFVEMAEYEGKILKLNLLNQPITILGDKDRLHQLFVILLDNAMKFTHDEGNIEVDSFIDNHMAHIKVVDNGIGISEENLSKIFDRFFQADKSRTNREGTGLGLSIAKWIVSKHKGKMYVESQPNKGTTFHILLPLNK